MGNMRWAGWGREQRGAPWNGGPHKPRKWGGHKRGPTGPSGMRLFQRGLFARPRGLSFHGFRNLAGLSLPQHTLGKGKREGKNEKKKHRLEWGILSHLKREGRWGWQCRFYTVTSGGEAAGHEEQRWQGPATATAHAPHAPGGGHAICHPDARDCAAQTRKRQARCRVPKSPLH